MALYLGYNLIAGGGGESGSGSGSLVYRDLTLAPSAFILDATYTDFPYRATIILENVTSTMVPMVFLSDKDVDAGIFSDIANPFDGGIYIYANTIPSSDVIINTIILQGV